MSFFDKDIDLAGQITMQQVIEVWGEEVADQLRHSLDAEGLGDSGLKQAINFTVTNEGTKFRFELFFPDYGTFIDEGVKGAGGTRKTTSKFRKSNNKGKIWKQNAPGSRFRFRDKKPPIEALKTWSRKRGINEYAVQEAVFRQGIKPKKWFSDVMDQNPVLTLIDSLQGAGAKQIELDMSKILTGKTDG